MKILTLNINFYGEKHGPWSERRKLIADAIIKTEPDVVALQAVGQEASPDGGKNQAAQLAELLPAYAAYFEPINEQQGMAILSRSPVTGINKLVLTRLPDQEDTFDRNLLHARVDSPLGPFDLFNAHFSWVDEQAVANVNETLPFINSFSGHKIMVGDFNQTPDKPSIGQLLRNGWTDAYAVTNPHGDAVTFEADRPTIRIDHIFVSSSLADHVESVEVVENSNGKVRMSDHHGLIATFC